MTSTRPDPRPAPTFGEATLDVAGPAALAAVWVLRAPARCACAVADLALHAPPAARSLARRRRPDPVAWRWDGSGGHRLTYVLAVPAVVATLPVAGVVWAVRRATFRLRALGRSPADADGAGHGPGPGTAQPRNPRAPRAPEENP